jgi:hypothetical protein
VCNDRYRRCLFLLTHVCEKPGYRYQCWGAWLSSVHAGGSDCVQDASKNLPGLALCRCRFTVAVPRYLAVMYKHSLLWPLASGRRNRVFEHLPPTVLLYASVYVNLRGLPGKMDSSTIRQALLKRNPAMTPEEFSNHWFTKHAPLVVPLFLQSKTTYYEQARDLPPFSCSSFPLPPPPSLWHRPSLAISNCPLTTPYPLTSRTSRTSLSPLF